MARALDYKKLTSDKEIAVLKSNGAYILDGSATTRNAVRLDSGDISPIGSMYVSTAGKIYLKIANAGADTDWQRVTTTAAD